MRKGRKSLALFTFLTLVMMLLASCVAPAVENQPTPSIVPTAEVKISLPPMPTPTPIPEYEDFQVGEIIWGPKPQAPDRATEGDPTFYEELLPDQSHAKDFAGWVYSTCEKCPAALVAAAYAFPSITVGCHFNTSDPSEMIDILYHREDGGEIQRKLLNGLTELLTSSGTQLEVVHVSGLVRMAQGYVIEPNGVYLTILGYSWSEPFLVRNATQLKVTRLFADGTKEIGYFDDQNDYCLSVPVEDGLVG